MPVQPQDLEGLSAGAGGRDTVVILSQRRRFKRDGVFPEKKFLCVYSEELPIETPESRAESSDQIAGSRHMRDNGSSVFVTATFGITIASLVIRSISEHNN